MKKNTTKKAKVFKSIEAIAYELDPKKFYLVVIRDDLINQDTITRIGKGLRGRGTNCAVLGTDDFGKLYVHGTKIVANSLTK